MPADQYYRINKRKSEKKRRKSREGDGEAMIPAA
jgi:hypothetical protein